MINSDSFGGVLSGIGSHNVFSYCSNEPVNKTDTTGHLPSISLQPFSMGLFHLICKAVEEKERARVNDEIRKIPKPKSDITGKLNSVMRTNAKTMQQIKKNSQVTSVALTSFAICIAPGGIWDLKEQSEFRGSFQYKDIVVEAQDIGNIHFGYVGKSLGLSNDLLLKSAGAAQILVGRTNMNFALVSNFDDPRD